MLFMQKKIFLFIIAVLLFSSGCQKIKHERGPNLPPTDTIKTSYNVIADSINYGVVIRNRDSTDIWREKWLSRLKRDSLVDLLFHAVYAKELQAYDYFTEEPLSTREVKKIEKREGFDRSRIGKIQFEEVWYFDPENYKMVKSVNSVMIAYETYRRDSTFRGYKPVFKVYLNKPFNR